jgi:hypothetical protein
MPRRLPKRLGTTKWIFFDSQDFAGSFDSMPESDASQPESRKILVPIRYAPGGSQRIFDDFFEIGTGPMPPPPPTKDASLLELAKFYLVACCPKAGAYSLPDGLINLVTDAAELITSTADKDIFLGRQKPPVALAIKEAITPELDRPQRAIAALYLATQFEFYFRILSGMLNFDGSWKSLGDRAKAESFLPDDDRVRRRGTSSVEVAYKLAILNNADPRSALLEGLDKAIRSRFQSSLYDNFGGRIAYVRNRGAHGEWDDVSAEGVFYATLTAILYFAST